MYDNGIGLRSIDTDISLVFGTLLHLGIQYMLEGLVFEDANKRILNILNTKLDEEEITDRRCEPQQLEHSWNEHRALLTALLWMYSQTELLWIRENYDTVTQEVEFETTLVSGDSIASGITDKSLLSNQAIILLSRVDAIFREKATGEFVIYSIKSTKDFDYRQEKHFDHDLQGLIEIWSTEQYLKRQIAKKDVVLAAINAELSGDLAETITNYINKKLPTSDKVMGVRYCHLVKGKRYQDEQYGIVTSNPLIYGYRKTTDKGTVEWAHSYQVINAGNKSGYGRLGKGWEKVCIWDDYPNGVIGWFNDIMAGLIQPNMPNPFSDLLITPPPVMKSEEEIFEAIEVVKRQESEIFKTSFRQLQSVPAEIVFPKYRHSCEYPVHCPFNDICWRPEIANDPLDSGMYEYRVSHHDLEAQWQNQQLASRDEVTDGTK